MLKKYQNEVKPIKIEIKEKTLNGLLNIPEKPKGFIIFAHGSGSSRLSPRNQFVASYLNQAHFATLLFDLLTQEEEEEDMFSGEHRFNISMLADRLMQVTAWALKQPKMNEYKLGYFGSSTGAAAALMAASHYQKEISAVVSRGGRPDLAGESLKNIKAPTLLIVGSLDVPVIELNTIAQDQMQNVNKLEIIPGATHLFEESDTLEQVAKVASKWFTKYL